MLCGYDPAATLPYLAGQYAPYTALELQMWQQGARRNSPEAMRLFARKLDGSEIAALAAYYEQAGGSSAAPPAASTSY
jgi:cytochrome c553